MGRNAWVTRSLGGGALLFAVLALWTLLFHAGMSVYRPDVAVLGAVALALAAGWVWSAARPIPVTPPRTVEPAPAPPAKLPWRRPFRDYLTLLLIVVAGLPALAVVTELMSRPDGDDLKRIAAIQKAGAEMTRGTIVGVHRVTSGKSKYMVATADLTVEVPLHGPKGGGTGGSTGTTRLKVAGGHVDVRFPVGSTMEPDEARSGLPGQSVPVLYAPTAPELGGVVDTPNHIERYLEADSPFAFSLPPESTQIALGLGVVLAVLAGMFIVRIPPYDPALRTLREDAAGGAALPAVRARIVAARRNQHTTFGEVDGTVRVRSDHKLRFALEDGSELLIGNPALEPAGLALLAARMGERPGWLCGARNWRLIRNGEQSVAFVTDEGEVAWLTMDREEFERVLGPATPVQPDAERLARLSPWPTMVVPGAHWPWLGGMLLSYGLVLVVLMVPMSWLAAWLTTLVAAVVAVAACVVLVPRRAALSDRTGRWEVRATRDPELGPA
ncbi:hypothetical protein [Streptomyces sp. NBC_00091]|uniref:hypothetical protein n=1 Tax=Streptomyces sp. NBC_00091 TaxID=2975648 RepID=UPI0022573821|nr:hypothetical protein [Streptomyces sp. NBC_00091]MCX5380796.1 hypothetical protein [Streptomyces sp. NBC_00091]